MTLTRPRVSVFVKRLTPLLLALGLHPAPVSAQGVEVEWSAGGGIGSKFTRRAPFEFDDVSFGGPYRACPVELGRGDCLLGGLADVAYALQTKYGVLGVAGIDVRRRLGGPLSIGAGFLVGPTIRERGLLRTSLGEVVAGRPLEPDDVLGVAGQATGLRTDGVGALAYLHAGLRWDHGFGTSTALGYRPAPVRLFVEAGGGWLPLVPGGEGAAIGRPPGIHLMAGVALRRGVTGQLILGLRHIRALAKEDDDLLIDSSSSWTMFQIGWVRGR